MHETGTRTDWLADPDRDASVMSAWERLVLDGKSRTGIPRGVVDDSWQRCLEGHVNPGVVCAPPPMEEGRLFDLRTKNERLMRICDPLIQQTREFLSQTGTI